MAFLLLATSLLAPWWQVANIVGGFGTVESARLWDEGLARPWLPWVTAAFVIAALPILFVRLAARSYVHEPASYRRDLAVSGVLALLACLSAWAWPREGLFWGTRRFDFESGGALEVVQSPATGWWLALVAACLLAWAWLWSSRE